MYKTPVKILQETNAPYVIESRRRAGTEEESRIEALAWPCIGLDQTQTLGSSQTCDTSHAYIYRLLYLHLSVLHSSKMLQTALRSARPAARSLYASRSFVTTQKARSGHGPAPPSLFGPGAKPGEIPTDYEQSTGLERLQLLGDLQGVPIFDTAPLDASRCGTKANPILVPSLAKERLVGCTGSPADSHDIRWFRLTSERQERCNECGSVHALDYNPPADLHNEGHH
jgi:cytochrome c oxidase subunit 5b